MAIGPIRVMGAVVNVLVAGSLLRCKPFVALGTAQASLRRLMSAARGRGQDSEAEQRRGSQGEDLQAEERRRKTCPPTSLARAKEKWLRAHRDENSGGPKQSERREKAMGTVEEETEGEGGELRMSAGPRAGPRGCGVLAWRAVACDG